MFLSPPVTTILHLIISNDTKDNDEEKVRLSRKFSSEIRLKNMIKYDAERPSDS